MNDGGHSALEISMVTFDCTDPEGLAAWWVGPTDAELIVAAAGEFVMVPLARDCGWGFRGCPIPLRARTGSTWSCTPRTRIAMRLG